MAKPWATSHVATVAAGLGIEHRISGDVKEKLVELLGERLRIITREMEEATLASDPGRKTLDDPVRTRLGFNRTKGLMVDHIRRQLPLDVVLQRPGANCQVAGSNQLLTALLLVLIRQQVTGNLFVDEPIESFIRIQSSNHIITISPCIPAFKIICKARRISIANNIQPVTTPPLSIVRRCQEPLNELFIGLWVGIVDKCINIFRSGW